MTKTQNSKVTQQLCWLPISVSRDTNSAKKSYKDEKYHRLLVQDAQDNELRSPIV